MINSKVRNAVIALAGAAACGGPPDNPSTDAGVADDLTPELRIAVEAGLDHLEAHAARFGLRGRGDLTLMRAFRDDLDLTHTRFQQTVNGVPVFGGEGIVHLHRDGSISAITDAFVPAIKVDTTPRLSADQAIGHAVPHHGCASCLTAPAKSDLWVLRHGGRDRLVWRVQLRIEDGSPKTALPVMFIDADNGELVWQYDNLQTGSGPSLYSGTVTFDTTPHAGLYYMEDLTRRLGTFDLRNGSSTLYRFEDADDIFDGTSQRAGLDAHWGALKTYEYLKNVHDRNGIDGNGGPTSELAVDGVTPLITSRVHYGSSYNNAFWNGTVMTYGDGNGSQFSPLVSLDVAGHEMMHGVTQHTAGLIYSGESGALNESYSDVFGALVERYARGDANQDAIWKIGDEIYTPATPGDALRYMESPHQASDKGYTADDDPDHYSERYSGGGDNGGVHINSGIANKTFYLLAMGGAHHLGGSMTGIGADKAAAIWYRALTTYMTSSTSFAGAARATYLAAIALHGESSPEVAAVVTAWGLVGVVVDLVAPEVAMTAPADGGTVIAPMAITASATDNVGIASVQFLIDGVVRATDLSAPFSYDWNPLGSQGTHTLAAKAFDAAGLSAQTTITVTIDRETVPPAVAITAPADGATVAGASVAVTADATDNIAIAHVELRVDGTVVANDTSGPGPYSFTWNTEPLPNGPHTLVARAFDTVGNTATSTAVTVTVDNDHTPPAVAITAPAEGAVVENTVTVEASASDNVGVTRVSFYVGTTLIGSDTTAPYQIAWNTHGYPDGNYELTARATDLRDNTATSAAVMVAVDNDSIPPVVAITAPTDGSTVTGTVNITAVATDNVAVTRVELLVDGVVVATGFVAPWWLPWNTLNSGNGAHSLTARAYDALNNTTTSSAVSVTANNPGIATYDAALGAPRCAAEGSLCDTGGMVNGRDGKGPELNAPNTLGGTCLDGTGGTYHVNESLDRLRVFTSDGYPIAAGKTVTIEATVWAASYYYHDTIDLYHTTNTSSPVWTHIGSLSPSGSGARTLSTTFTLPSGTQHALRGQFRYQGSLTPCFSGSSSDRDDLVFTVLDVPDTTPPITSITAPAAGAQARGAMTVSATATDNIAVTAVELLVDGAPVATDTAAPYSFTWDSTTVPDGAHTLTVRALDPAGNAGPSAPVAITVNNIDTDPPTAAITSPAQGATVWGARSIFTTATDDFAVASVELYINGTLIGTDTTSPYTFAWNTTPVPNGPYTLYTRAYDTLGHMGQSAPVTVNVANTDSTSPTTSITSPAEGAMVAGATEVIATASDFNGVSKVDLYIDGALAQTATTSPYTFTWDTTTKPNGSHALKTRAYDPSSNSAYSATVTVTVGNVDTTPPAVSITAPANGTLVSGTKTVSVSATDVHGIASVELYVDGTKVATDTTSPYNLSWNTNTPPNGPRVLTARAIDGMGNAGQSAPITVTVNNPDNTAPTTSITSPTASETVSGTNTVTAAANDNFGVTSLELLLDGAVIATVTSAPWSFTWDTTTVANKTHTLRTRARDAAGNTGQSALVSVTVDNGIGAAVFDPTLQAPMCAVGYDGCDTGTLVNGRAGLGPEPNFPNTLNDSCGDGGGGGFHSSTSIDRLRVFTTDGTPLAGGKTVVVEVTMWNFYNLLEQDVIDFYYTTSPSSPSWTLIGSVAPGSPQGIRVASTSFSLPHYESQIAVRATTRRKAALGANTPSTCAAGAYNDRDDLVFTVGGP